MKGVLILTGIFELVTVTCIGCLMIFDIVSVERGTDLILKAMAVIFLLGAVSAFIALVVRQKNNPTE
jgi:hypothetical protein